MEQIFDFPTLLRQTLLVGPPYFGFDGLYLLVFGELGTQDEMAVALGLLQLVIVMIVALPGGPIYSFYKAEGRVPRQATTE